MLDRTDSLADHPTLGDLAPACCRWPVGPDADGVERFCGRPIQHRSGAGGEHAALMYRLSAPLTVSYRPKHGQR